MLFGRALSETNPGGVGPSMLFVYKTDPEGVGYLMFVLDYLFVAVQYETDPAGVGLLMRSYLAGVRVSGHISSISY